MWLYGVLALSDCVCRECGPRVSSVVGICCAFAWLSLSHSMRRKRRLRYPAVPAGIRVEKPRDRCDRACAVLMHTRVTPALENAIGIPSGIRSYKSTTVGIPRVLDSETFLQAFARESINHHLSQLCFHAFATLSVLSLNHPS